MPIKVFMYEEERRKDISLSISGYVCKNDELGENEVFLCDKDSIEMDWDKWYLLFEGKYYKVDHHSSFDVDSFLGGYKTYAKFNTPSELVALRNLVYSIIESEIKAVIKVLFNYYGVQKK